MATKSTRPARPGGKAVRPAQPAPPGSGSARRTPMKVKNRWSFRSVWPAVAIVVVAVAIVAAFLTVVIRNGHHQAKNGPSASGPALKSDATNLNPSDLKARLTANGVASYDERSDPGQNHVPQLGSVKYTVDPPAGGAHSPTGADPGWYVGHQVPPDMTAVHSLEHGYVDIWVRPDLSRADLDAIHKVFASFQMDVLVLPRASLQVPVAATVWHRRLLLNRVDPQVLVDFIAAYRNQGPEAIPHSVAPAST